MTGTGEFTLFSSVSACRGIGEKRARALVEAGFPRFFDVLRLVPRRYEDRTVLLPLSAAKAGPDPLGVFRVLLVEVKLNRFGSRKCVVWARFSEDPRNSCPAAAPETPETPAIPADPAAAKASSSSSFSAAAVTAATTAAFEPNGASPRPSEFLPKSGLEGKARWFNQPYLTKTLIPGKAYYLFGRILETSTGPVFDNPEIEAADDEEVDRPAGLPVALTPVYPRNVLLQGARISPKVLRGLIARNLAWVDWEGSFPDLSEEAPFVKLQRAFQDLHLPSCLEAARKAREVLAFFDQVLFQMGVIQRRIRLCGEESLPEEETQFPEPILIYSPPFQLTGDQKQALAEIQADVRRSFPMNRLLQGEVGSGKTMVSFLAMIDAVIGLNPGSQAVFMAPTAILAAQHFRSFARFFPELASQAILLTGSVSGEERRHSLAEIRSGTRAFLFGTHALFQEGVEIPHPVLCIIDEQHKFGVEQRRALVQKGGNRIPHCLLISATPIPRSLSLTVFGDMRVSQIKSVPPGRGSVSTRLSATLAEALEILAEHLRAGRQGFVVCPVISETEKIKVTSVEQALIQCRRRFSGVRVESLTGQDSPERVSAVMSAFVAGDIRLLVATTIIEVGVDVANASCMVIENADRFGLSQLHQLRGRISRCPDSAECIAVCGLPEEVERLKVFAGTGDGFIIAGEDLRLRGPGDLVGKRQSGLFHPAMANIHRIDLVEKARKRVLTMLKQDPEPWRNWFEERMRESFGDAFQTFLEGG
jgi:ATP-dependent DNA helicase RecG